MLRIGNAENPLISRLAPPPERARIALEFLGKNLENYDKF